MSRYDELTGLVEGLGTDFNKFYGNVRDSSEISSNLRDFKKTS